MRFWKDTAGRYLDRAAVEALLRDGHTGVLDGFTARNGRTYRGSIEIDRDQWKLTVNSEGWNEEAASDQPEYEVNTEPLGRCPICEEFDVVETPTQFACAERLKEQSEREAQTEKGKRRKKPKVCGFVMSRTVCKREITREEFLVYLRTGKTELLESFTSRFGRPFSATLVLKESGRHGFEFPPRKKKGSRRDGRGGHRRRCENHPAKGHDEKADLQDPQEGRDEEADAQEGRGEEGDPQEGGRPGRQPQEGLSPERSELELILSPRGTPLKWGVLSNSVVFPNASTYKCGLPSPEVIQPEGGWSIGETQPP